VCSISFIELDRSNQIVLYAVGIWWGSFFSSVSFVIPRLVQVQLDKKSTVDVSSLHPSLHSQSCRPTSSVNHSMKYESNLQEENSDASDASDDFVTLYPSGNILNNSKIQSNLNPIVQNSNLNIDLTNDSDDTFVPSRIKESYDKKESKLYTITENDELYDCSDDCFDQTKIQSVHEEANNKNKLKLNPIVSNDCNELNENGSRSTITTNGTELYVLAQLDQYYSTEWKYTS
jgi:hypothetical protein